MNELRALEDTADALKDEGKHEEAIAEYKKILEKDNDFVRAHLALAILYDKVQDAEKSVYHGERACEIEPNDHFNAVALSITYQKAFETTRDEMYIHKAEEAKARAHILQS